MSDTHRTFFGVTILELLYSLISHRCSCLPAPGVSNIQPGNWFNSPEQCRVQRYRIPAG